MGRKVFNRLRVEHRGARVWGSHQPNSPTDAPRHRDAGVRRLVVAPSGTSCRHQPGVEAMSASRRSSWRCRGARGLRLPRAAALRARAHRRAGQNWRRVFPAPRLWFQSLGGVARAPQRVFGIDVARMAACAATRTGAVGIISRPARGRATNGTAGFRQVIHESRNAASPAALGVVAEARAARGAAEPWVT